MIAFLFLLLINYNNFDSFPEKGLTFNLPGPRNISGNILKTNDGFLIIIQMKPTSCLDETRNQKINSLNLKAYGVSIFNKYIAFNPKLKITELHFKLRPSNNQSVAGELLLKLKNDSPNSSLNDPPQKKLQDNVLKITNFTSGKIWNETLDYFKSESTKDIKKININELNSDQFDNLIADLEKMWLNTFRLVGKELSSDLFLFENDIPEENSRPNLIQKNLEAEKIFLKSLAEIVEKRIKFEESLNSKK
ncbi:MAG: hypothetical protein ACO3F3_07515 [Gemmataceae bacterium]